ncbi:MAG TPA: glycosyl hydrolase, partial [Hyphomonas sp.]|nr:glycosyl hydrolase [Hyphomonas sp.]
MRLALALMMVFAFLLGSARAAGPECGAPLGVCEGQVAGAFPLIAGEVPVAVMADAADWPGVLRAASNLTTDLSELARGEAAAGEFAIIAGTLGRSAVIDRLVAEGRLDVSAIDGVWEGYVQAIVEAPAEGISRALVIAGADKRGTIYGIYDLSERAGVSPWKWWADVPVPHRPELSVTAGSRADWPRVKYRGIFINDEKPALHGWVNHYYGGFKSGFYERVFELILRNKGNYLWPAMWGEAIYDDDPLSGPLADEMGVVVGKSHHEPMGRAHVEWARYGEGRWDYTSNEEVLRGFWRDGIERLKDWETIVTLGMRGDGDEAMTEGTAIALLERIVADQRGIITDVTGKPAAEQPSIWALYKEVQDYYDQGMDVPEDVTLLFADDNWGNIRRLPESGSERAGGYGVYYHFDYVGGPRNYKWLNTNQIERVWEQMNLAWEFGARQTWIVNVGDIKPMEFPISFFLDQAWNPEAMPRERMSGYTEVWAAQQFPAEHAGEIAQITELYTKYVSRRKHELVDPKTFSVVNFDEFRRVTAELEALAARADAVRAKLPAEYDDAYVQLVWFPVLATTNLYQLYEAAALNRLYTAQGRAMDAQAQANRVEAFFAHDAELTRVYHEDVADGKWVHMMSQTHIGYTYWQQPDNQVMPAVERPEVSKKARLGVAVEGD